MSDQQQKIVIPMRKRQDRGGRPFYVGRPRLPVSLQLDRFIALVFPFPGDPGRGVEEGAELVFELAYEDSTYRNASKTLRRLAERIRDPGERRAVLSFLSSISGEDHRVKDDGPGLEGGRAEFMDDYLPRLEGKKRDGR